MTRDPRMPPAQPVRGVTDEPRPYGEPARFPIDQATREVHAQTERRQLVVGGGAVPASTDLNLNFGANAYLVDNFTSQWVRIGGDEFVPPYTRGVVIVGNGSQRMRADFTAPPQFVQPTAVNGELANIYATNEHLAPFSGIVMGADIIGNKTATVVKIADATTVGNQAAVATDADAMASALGLVALARSMGFNGTTWDRMRTGAGGDLLGVPFEAPQGSSPQTATAAVNTAVTITLAAVAGQRNYLTFLEAFGTGGAINVVLIIQDGGVTKTNVPVNVAASTPVSRIFANPWRAGVNATLIVTLPAGGAAVTGVLSIGSYTG